ncbi:6604_t:CDS:1, partial [Gigaspora margarita]
TFRTHAPKVVHTSKISEAISQIDPEIGSSTQSNIIVDLESYCSTIDIVNQEDTVLDT